MAGWRNRFFHPSAPTRFASRRFGGASLRMTASIMGSSWCTTARTTWCRPGHAEGRLGCRPGQLLIQVVVQALIEGAAEHGLQLLPEALGMLGGLVRLE